MLNDFLIYIYCIGKVLLQFICYLVPLFVIMALITKAKNDKCWASKLINKMVNMEV